MHAEKMFRMRAFLDLRCIKTKLLDESEKEMRREEHRDAKRRPRSRIGSRSGTRRRDVARTECKSERDCFTLWHAPPSLALDRGV